MHKSKGITWHNSKVSPQDRAILQRQNALTVWLTGLSASGKSTLSYELERRLHDLGHASFVLDGDNIRHGLSGDVCDAGDNVSDVRASSFTPTSILPHQGGGEFF